MSEPVDVAAVVVFSLSAAGVVWVYAGYPLALLVAGHWRPRLRVRAPITPSVSVIVAAHNEAAAIARKITNIRASEYPDDLIEVVIASDGSTDETVERARAAGADRVLDLPRNGKLAALNEAAATGSGEILVFTDADSTFAPGTLARLVSNFADADVGGVAGSVVRTGGAGVGTGEGLYWRYEEWIKRVEDRVGSAVSATGHLYAVRRELFQPSSVRDGTDDFVISTQVIRAGRRLAFDGEARVATDPAGDGRSELRRKVRVMNRGLRAVASLGPLLLPWRGGLYCVQVVSHKLLRRFVPFLLALALVTSAALVVSGHPAWWLALAPQFALYTFALAGWIGERYRFARRRLFMVAYYFCLANLAAAIAVVSIVRGRRYAVWQPDRSPESASVEAA